MNYKEAHFLGPVPTLIVAIDIGKSYSGFALSFKDSPSAQMSEQYQIMAWNKVPSAILLAPDMTFVSFGHEAIDEYNALPEKTKREHYYIRSFKSSLICRSSSKNVNPQTCKPSLRDSRNREVNSLHVYTAVLKYFKQLAIVASENYERHPGVNKTNALWMVTLPAECSDWTRHFLHEAAILAGIPKDCLRLVCESEAAMIFCLENSSLLKTLPDHRYVIADIKGECIEMSLYTIQKGGWAIEMDKATLNGLGGNHVNDEVIAFLSDLFGECVWTTFQTNHAWAYHVMLRDIESKIIEFSGDTHTISMSLHTSLLEKLQDNGLSIDTLVSSLQFKHLVAYDHINSVFYLQKNLVKAFFLSTVKAVVENLHRTVKECGIFGVAGIVLTGGFSECPYIKETLVNEFRPIEVIAPVNRGVGVLNGAIMMGHSERGVDKRLARFTYGIAVCVPFVEGLHPQHLKKAYDGEEWCENVFQKFIERGQSLKLGERIILSTYSTAIDSKLKYDVMDTLFYMSKLKNPKYCDRLEGCTLLGKTPRSPPVGGWPKFWKGEIHLVVEQHHFTLEFISESTKQVHRAKMSFM